MLVNCICVFESIVVGFDKSSVLTNFNSHAYTNVYYNTDSLTNFIIICFHLVHYFFDNSVNWLYLTVLLWSKVKYKNVEKAYRMNENVT